MSTRAAKVAPPDLGRRLALRLPEAALALGLSESSLRRLLPELDGCVLRAGGCVLLTVDGLRRWLDRQTAAEDAAASAEADALLGALDK